MPLRNRSCLASGWRSLAAVASMEPLFEGDEWASLRKKRNLLRRSRKHLLLAKLTDAEKQAIRRYIFVDLGSRSFSSSTEDFLNTYPESRRFHVHAFEMDEAYAKEWRSTALQHGTRAMSFHLTQAGVSDRDGRVVVAAGSKALMKNIAGKGYTGQQARTGAAASAAASLEEIRTLNFSRWLKKNVDESDFVVVKMDIEGSEYVVLPSLLASGAIVLIDEMMLETHYDRRSWKSTDRSAVCSAARNARIEQSGNACIHRHEALTWIHYLRSICVHVHEWT
mmetsp:Transcript_34841/g.57629  ORF Transcript_34841/g.57629 Transcript_34841/m.57629 type:complete len:280 (+) Transcript_34841:2-841(+)